MRTALAALALALPILASAQQFAATPAQYLDRMDANHDGKISEAEYVQYMSASFRSLDANGDGVLEPDELPGGRGKSISLQQFQDNLKRQFHRLDRNGDGYLNARELAQPPQG